MFKLLIKLLRRLFNPGPQEKIINKIDNVATPDITEKGMIRQVAKELECEPELIEAFFDVESSGKNYDKNKRLIIRFEKHIFNRYSDDYNDTYLFHVKHTCQDDEYKSFNQARNLDREAAYKSISMGSSQIMGFNSKRCGYKTAEEMYSAFCKSSLAPIQAFGEFVKSDKKLLKACREKDYHMMASRYNGKSYKKYTDNLDLNYADKIEINYLNRSLL
jgi:hypothetical protein